MGAIPSIFRQRWTRHGYAHHPLYSVHQGMMRRCYVSDTVGFEDYGGRGITICEHWHSMKNFGDDNIASYRDGLTLDRIDFNGNYEPSNCRWIPKSEQSENRRGVTLITIGGITKTLSKWAKHNNISAVTALARVRIGWSPTDAVTKPVRGSKPFSSDPLTVAKQFPWGSAWLTL